jgi:hypothetical protein
VVQSAMTSIAASKKFAPHAYEINLGAESRKGNLAFFRRFITVFSERCSNSLNRRASSTGCLLTPN